MRSVSHTHAGLLRLEEPNRLRMLYMAPYAPNGSDFDMSSYTGDGGYPGYYFEIFKRLFRLGFQVESTSKPYAIVHAKGNVDYVFSLYNRIPIRNSEVFISAYCEYLNLPYLGACPNVRALAEDKYVSKLVAKSLGIPVPRGEVYHQEMSPLRAPSFPGPYFIKDRYGAGSRGLTTDNLQGDWDGAKRIIRSIWEQDTDAMVEQMVDGIDITVPVVGDVVPRVLGIVHVPSDKPHNVLTEDLKLTDPLGYRMYDSQESLINEIEADTNRLWADIGPIDYFRLDYRFDPKSGKRRFLEFNVCCYISEHGAFGLAGTRRGIAPDDLLAHIVSYSIIRQKRRRENTQRIL